MTAIKSLHSRTFERLIAQQQAVLMASLVTGVDDYATYRQIVGRLQGLDDALRISEQADYELSGDEPDASA